MAKGSFITPFFLGSKSSAAAAAPAPPPDDQPAAPNPSRMSTSSRFPSLRRLETTGTESGPSTSRPSSVQSRPAPSVSGGAETPAAGSSAHQSNSLLHLKFTGPSFLDVVAKDNVSKEPVYIIETVRDRTSIYRLDRVAREPVKAATVQWPQSLVKGKTSGRTVQMGDGRWRDTEEFLKFGSLANFSTRKFHIPHYPHPLKWKLAPGNSYFCTTQEVKGPIAVLDAAVLSAPPRLRVYHNFTDGDDRTQQNIRGVPVLLLDYLVTTSLILVTEVQEWLDRPQTVNGRVRIPGSSAPVVQRWLALIHGEPLPASPSSPTLTATTSHWDERSNRHSAGSSSSDPITPSTPGTSNGSFFSPRNEDIPPVPPLPETVRSSLIQPVAFPQAYASSENLLSQGSSSASLHPPTTKSSLRGSRPLPTPPALGSSLSAPRPWPSADGRTPSPSTPAFDRPGSPASSSSSTSNSRRSRGARSSIGRSLTVANMPPLQPPPAAALPLPPKLAQELGARAHAGPGEASGSSSASAAVLQMRNPDPLPPDEEARVRERMHALHLAASPPPPVPPPLAGPSPAYDAPYGAAAGELRDAGMVPMADASRRRSYAETVYEQPPPAYDAIDFSLPQVHLPRR